MTAYQALVCDFARARSLNLPRIEYLAGWLLDDALRAAFVAHHVVHARLVVVSRETKSVSPIRIRWRREPYSKVARALWEFCSAL